ncbi:hypothetical protein D3C78_1104390 [compost metagenome]
MKSSVCRKILQNPYDLYSICNYAAACSRLLHGYCGCNTVRICFHSHDLCVGFRERRLVLRYLLEFIHWQQLRIQPVRKYRRPLEYENAINHPDRISPLNMRISVQIKSHPGIGYTVTSWPQQNC